MTVRIEIVSTCPRWDMSMMSGKDMFDASKQPDYPLSPGFPGHEMAGTVGSKVASLKVGDRVAALEHLLGNGAYAEYLNYREHELIKLPDNVEWKQAVSFELLKCVLIGLGIGVAKHSDELGDERFDLGYDCVGAAASVQNVLERVDSHVVIFGVLKGEVRYGGHLWFRGVKLESYKYRSFGGSDQALLLDLVANKGLNTVCLQTHHIPFYRYQETIELLKKQEAIKVYAYPPPTDFAAAAEGR